MVIPELGVKAVKANARETLEAIDAILDIEDKRIAGAKCAKDSGEGWSSIDFEKNWDADKAKEEYDIRLVRLDAFITYCERGMSNLSSSLSSNSQKCAVESKDMILKCILDDLFQFFFFWILTCVLWGALLYTGLLVQTT